MVAVVVLFIMIIIGFSVFNIVSLKVEQHQVYKRQMELKEEKARLEKELKNSDDLKNLEEQARNQLRLVKPGETIYLFSEDLKNAEELQDSDNDED